MPTIEIGQGTALADFNRVDEHGRLTVSRSHFRGLTPGAGDVIYLEDADGNACEAVVERINARLITTRPYLWTWVDAPHVRAVIEREIAPVQTTWSRPGPARTAYSEARA